MSDRFMDILQQMRASRFTELPGARAVITLPVAEAVLNRFVDASLPASAPVRAVSIHPEAANHLSVRIIPRIALLPSLTIELAIEEQPRLPESPVLVLRMVTLGGLFGLASGAISGMLPLGIVLQGERLLVDLRALALARGAAEPFGYLRALRVETEPGRLVLHVEAAVQ